MLSWPICAVIVSWLFNRKHYDWVGAGRALLACTSLMPLLPLTHPVQCVHVFINEHMQPHYVDSVLQYNGNLWHKLLAKSWVMHCSPIMVLFSFFSSVLFSSPNASLHPHISSYWVWRYRATSGLFCCLVPWALTPMCTQKSTHVHYTHTHTLMHRESPLVLFLTVLYAAATFYWWLTTATSSVTFLRFANLHQFPFPAWFCISVPTGWMSVSILSIQISPWYCMSCILLDISNIWWYPWYFPHQIAFYFIKYQTVDALQHSE